MVFFAKRTRGPTSSHALHLTYYPLHHPCCTAGPEGGQAGRPPWPPNPIGPHPK
jgi:hypothetical protein